MVRALYAAGHLALFQGNYAAGRPLLERCADAYRCGGDGPHLLDALSFLGMAANHLGDWKPAEALMAEIAALVPTLTGRRERATFLFSEGRRALLWRGDAAAALARLQESLALFRSLGDTWFATLVLGDLGLVALSQGDLPEAHRCHEESLSLSRTLGDRALEASALNNLGEVARCAGDVDQAADLYDESLDLFRKLGQWQDIPRLLHNIACVALRRGETERAAALFRQSLEHFREIGLARGIAEGLIGLAVVCTLRAETAKAIRLWGAAEAWRAAAGASWWPADRPEHERYLATARAHLNAARFTAIWAEGSALTLDEAADVALREG